MPPPKSPPPRKRDRRSRSRSKSPDYKRKRSPHRHRPRSGSPRHLTSRRSPARRPSPRRSPQRRSPPRRSPLRRFSPPRRFQKGHISPRRRSLSPRARQPPPYRRQSKSPGFGRKRSRSPLRRRSRSPHRPRSRSRDRGHVRRKPASSTQDEPRGKETPPFHITVRSQRSPSPIPDRRLREDTGYQRSPRREGFSPFSPIDLDPLYSRDDPFSRREATPPRGHSPRYRQSPSPYDNRRRYSMSPPLYMDHVPQQPLFPSAKYQEISSVRIPVPLDHRQILLNDRFRTAEQEAQGAFQFDENITIGIHRGPQHVVTDSSPVPVDYDIKMSSFVMLHSKTETYKPMFDREEIKVFRHDEILDEEAYIEKRTITVMPSEKHGRYRESGDYRITVPTSSSGHYGEDTRRTVLNRSDSRADRSSRRSRSNHDRPSSSRQPEVRLDPRPDPRYERIFRESQGQEMKERLRQEKLQQNPNDLRNLLLKKEEPSRVLDARSRIEARRRVGPGRRGEDMRRVDRSRGGDVREVRSRDTSRIERGDRDRDRIRERGRSPRGSSKERKRSSSRPEENLPDFKKRPDKFTYEEWKDKPEMIPKGPSYYEHDDREDFEIRRGGFRGRGFRGFRSSFRSRGGRGRGFVGRGDYRGGSRDGGSFRGRGSYSGDRKYGSGGGEWKHDMFDKMEKEEDNHPTSTTKN